MVRIEFNRAYPIYLYKPGDNVYVSTTLPVAGNDTSANPKVLTYTLTQGGEWILVIRHYIRTTTVLVPFTFRILTDLERFQCKSYCSGIANTAGTVFGADNKCNCISKYSWDDINKQCVINCPSILNNNGAVDGSITQCKCQTGFTWDDINKRCLINCNTIANAIGRRAGFTDQCNC